MSDYKDYTANSHNKRAGNKTKQTTQQHYCFIQTANTISLKGQYNTLSPNELPSSFIFLLFSSASLLKLGNTLTKIVKGCRIHVVHVIPIIASQYQIPLTSPYNCGDSFLTSQCDFETTGVGKSYFPKNI